MGWGCCAKPAADREGGAAASFTAPGAGAMAPATSDTGATPAGATGASVGGAAEGCGAAAV